MVESQDTPSSYYRPDIDGLRALAVVAVVLFHANIPGFSGGFVGVDIFFVISGFLITSILVREMERRTFSLLTFFERRVRRIVPALFFMVLATLVVGYFVLLFPIDYRELGQSALAQSIFLANFFFVREGGYFSPLAENIPLLHTWTLAVEEQFYIVFPIFLFLIWRFCNTYLLPILVVCMSASFALSIYLLNVSPQESFSLPFFPDIWGNATNAKVAFYLLPSRAWEFVIGGLIAVTHVAIHKKYHATVLSVLGLGAIMYSILFYDKSTVFPGIAALLPVLGSVALIIAHTKQKTFIGQFLSFPLFVGIGLISYSLYLWHWPILVLTRQYLDIELSSQLTALLIAISFGVAYLSYCFIETPFRRKQICAGRTSMLVVGLGAIGILALLSILIVKNEGFVNRAPVEARNIATAAVDFGSRRNECFVNSFSVTDEPCALGVQDSENVSFVLWGDSHAGGILPLIDTMAKEYAYKGVSFISPGCQPALQTSDAIERNACDKVNKLAVSYIQTHAITHVLITAHWVGTEKNLIDIIAFYESKGVHFTIIHEPPMQTNFDMRKAFYAVAKGKNISDVSISFEDYKKNQASAIAMVEELLKFQRVTTIDPASLLCDDSKCNILLDDLFIYYDNRHLNVAGVHFLKPLFKEFFESLDSPY